MKIYILIIIFTSAISIFLYANIFQPRINVGGYVRYEVIQTKEGLYPRNVSAFGVLRLTKDQPADMNQLFKIDFVDNKLVLTEGLVEKNGTIVMPSTKILEIVSVAETELIAKNEIWTITITKNSVIITDKNGEGGNLVSGFAGVVDYGLTLY